MAASVFRLSDPGEMNGRPMEFAQGVYRFRPDGSGFEWCSYVGGYAKDTVNDFVHHNALRPDGGDTVLITEQGAEYITDPFSYDLEP